MNVPLLQDGTFLLGLVVDGVRHMDFTLRSPTVQDNIDAIYEVGAENPVELSAAIFARQLVKLGTLEPKQITTNLLRPMHPRDFNRLELASAELEKKLLLGVASSAGGSPAEQPLPATAFPSITP